MQNSQSESSRQPKSSHTDPYGLRDFVFSCMSKNPDNQRNEILNLIRMLSPPVESSNQASTNEPKTVKTDDEAERCRLRHKKFLLLVEVFEMSKEDADKLMNSLNFADDEVGRYTLESLKGLMQIMCPSIDRDTCEALAHTMLVTF